MKAPRNRREFLSEVGRGMLIASVGLGAAIDLELTPALAAEEGEGEGPLRFGSIEPLVELMQESTADQIVPRLVERLQSGTNLNALLAAAALANARTFGGEDYVGFHTMMALAPAYHMADELPEERRALPVLKVLRRNTNRIQEHGGRKSEVLHEVRPAPLSEATVAGEAIRDAVRRKDMELAERTFAAVAAQGSPEDAFNAVLYAVEDNTDVHRVVLPYRAWDLLGLIGKDRAHTMLRQSVRYCVKSERDWRHTREIDEPRTLLPRLLDQYRLPGRAEGERVPDDAWVEAMSKTIFESNGAAAADAVAAALADGIAPTAIGEAISLAANQLVLRDAGRPPQQAGPGKPPGSVHGDSIGVHACDSANAWRNMARAANPRNRVACLILSAYQVATDRTNRGGDFLHWTPRPTTEALEGVKSDDQATLLREAEAAIRSNDQARATAIVHRYGTLGHAPRPAFDLLLRYAISEDGALHAEKYYRTVREEYAATRAPFRWRQVTALARVTASEYGRPAPGYAEALQLLKLKDA